MARTSFEQIRQYQITPRKDGKGLRAKVVLHGEWMRTEDVREMYEPKAVIFLPSKRNAFLTGGR